MKDDRQDLWTLLQGEYDGNPLLVRYRQLDEPFDKAAYPFRINIFWTMVAPDDNGLASDDELTFLDLFEDRIIDAVEADGGSILSLVLTCDGKREFVFHTGDPEAFVQSLTEMPHEEEPYPIEIHCYEDKDWEYDAAVTQTG